MNKLITNTIEQMLNEFGLRYQQENNFFHLSISEDIARFHLNIFADEEKELLIVSGLFPINIPHKCLDKMYKLINKINRETTIGRFCIDPEDGELTYTVANNVDGGAINVQIVRACISQVYLRLVHTFDEIMDTIYDQPKPELPVEDPGITSLLNRNENGHVS